MGKKSKSRKERPSANEERSASTKKPSSSQPTEHQTDLRIDEDPLPTEAPLARSNEAKSPESPAISPKTSKPQAPADADFSALYLRTVTSEFADDLERLRGAKDFKDSSVPVLVEALKQGAGLYSMGEQERLRRAWGKEGV